MKTKICTNKNCKYPEKSLSEFSKNNQGKDDLQDWCKECVKDYQDKNKEKIAQYQKEHYERNKEERLKYQKERYKENKQEIKEYRLRPEVKE